MKLHNSPDTIQLGDAFQVREDGWSLPGLAMKETVAPPTVEATTKRRPEVDLYPAQMKIRFEQVVKV